VVRLEITDDRKGQAIQAALNALKNKPSGKTLNDVHNALCLENGWSPLWMSSNPNAPSLQKVKENLRALVEEKNISRVTLSFNNAKLIKPTLAD